MATTPLINGRRYSFASIELAATIAGNPSELFADVDAISYGDSLDVAYRYGTSRGPIGWTAGTYNPGDASIQMGKSTAQQMIQRIGPGWLGINLLIGVKYFDIGEQLTVDTLVARIVGLEDSHQYSADALVSVMALKPFSILRNGIFPLLNRVI
jgi:hypothetical protein